MLLGGPNHGDAINEHVACMGTKRNILRDLVEEPEGKKLLEM